MRYELINGDFIYFDENESYVSFPDKDEVLPIVNSDDLNFLLSLAGEKLIDLSDKDNLNSLSKDETELLSKLRQVIEFYQDYTDFDPWY